MRKSFVVALALVMFTFTFLGHSLAQAAAPGFVKINSSPVTTTNFTDSSCPNQIQCYYQVTAVDSAGFESKPATCSATGQCVGGNETFVAMPNSGTHTVSVTWVASSTTGVTYNVYQHVGPFPASNLGSTVN